MLEHKCQSKSANETKLSINKSIIAQNRRQTKVVKGLKCQWTKLPIYKSPNRQKYHWIGFTERKCPGQNIQKRSAKKCRPKNVKF